MADLVPKVHKPTDCLRRILQGPHALSFKRTWTSVRFTSDSVRHSGLDLGVVYHKTTPEAGMLSVMIKALEVYLFTSLLTGSHGSQADLECTIMPALHGPEDGTQGFIRLS